MTLAEALEKIKALEGGPDLVSAITAHTEELRKESAGYRTKLKDLEPEKAKLLEELESLRKEKGKGGAEALEAEVRRLRQDLDAEKAAREEAQTSARRSKTESILKDALAKHKAVRPEDLVELHMGRAKFKDDGTPYFVDASGAERTVEEHVQAWLKDRPELVHSTQRPGPGAGDAKPKEGTKSITRAEYAAAQSEQNNEVLRGVGAGSITITD